MIETIAGILVVIRLLGFFTANTMVGLIHILLVFVIVVLQARVFWGATPLIFRDGSMPSGARGEKKGSGG